MEYPYKIVNFTPAASRSTTHVLGSKYNSFNYEYLLSRAQPFDLLLFRSDDVISRSIIKAEKFKNKGSDFSHCGMIVTRKLFPDLKMLDRHKLYLWEATSSLKILTTDSAFNVEDGRSKLGIQIRDLEGVLNGYVEASDDKAMSWCRLKSNPWVLRVGESTQAHRKRKKRIIEQMSLLHSKFAGRGFEINPAGCFSTIFPPVRPLRTLFDVILIAGYETLVLSHSGCKNFQKIWEHAGKDSDSEEELSGELNQPTSRWLFCSEMVALIYKEFKILNSTIIAANMCPTDFIQDHLNLTDQPILIFPAVQNNFKIRDVKCSQIFPDLINIVKNKLN